MHERATLMALLCATLVLAPAAASAQQAAPLSQLLVQLIQGDIRLAPPAPPFPSHEAHFEPGADQQIAPFFFNQQLVAQLATIPIGSSSGGFSYTFDPTAATFNRATDSFGPTFAERALTNGRGRLTIGGNVQYSKYTSFEGQDIRNGDVKFYLRHASTGGAFFEGDLVQADLKLNLSSTTTTLYANYGLTNNWDVSVAVPFQRVSLDATVDATVLRLATAGLAIHAFPGGGTTASFVRSGSASGIGDVILRTKYRFLSAGAGGLAAGFDLRLPSGDAENLLGTGATGATFTVIGSSAYGPVAPHFNIGYSASRAGSVVNIPNELDYRFGSEVVAGPRLTLVGDIVGRSLRNAGRLELTDTVWNYRNQAGVPGSTTLHEFTPTSTSLNIVSAAVGGKVNVVGNLLVSANVLFALSSAGVTARVTPVVGLEYSF